MWHALLMVAPELADAPRVSRASTSAGLFRRDTGESILGSNGAHHYVLVLDAGDVGRMSKDLHDRSWLHGLGWHLIGRAGQLLSEASLIAWWGPANACALKGRLLLIPRWRRIRRSACLTRSRVPQSAQIRQCLG